MSTIITSLPNNISNTLCGYPKTFECMICLENLSDSLSSDVNNTLADVRDFSLCCEIDCLHVFHRSCLEQWFALEKLYCPCCNEQQINISDSIRPVPFRTESEYTTLIRKRFTELIELRRIISEQLEHDDDFLPVLEPLPFFEHDDEFLPELVPRSFFEHDDDSLPVLGPPIVFLNENPDRRLYILPVASRFPPEQVIRNSYEYTFIDNSFFITRNEELLEENSLITIILNNLTEERRIHYRGNSDSFANEDDSDTHFREGEILNNHINILHNLIHN